jgi:hypothetical protein
VRLLSERCDHAHQNESGAEPDQQPGEEVAEEDAEPYADD